MGEFLLGLFVILILVGAFYEQDELIAKNRQLEQEAERQRESIKLERMALDLERKRIRQLDAKLKLDKEILKQKAVEKMSNEYLTSKQIVKSLTLIVALAICIVLFFRMIYSS